MWCGLSFVYVLYICVCMSVQYVCGVCVCDTHRQWLVLEQQAEVGCGGGSQGVGCPHLPTGEDNRGGGRLGPVRDGGTFGRGLREAQTQANPAGGTETERSREDRRKRGDLEKQREREGQKADTILIHRSMSERGT